MRLVNTETRRHYIPCRALSYFHNGISRTLGGGGRVRVNCDPILGLLIYTKILILLSVNTIESHVNKSVRLSQ